MYDVAVIGGGPVGLCAAYEVAKSGHSVVVLEKNNFFNQAGSSGDLARMFRTMYTEDFMADLAHDALSLWDELERDAGETGLRLMTGLLNFGDPKYGAGGPEGTLTGPVPNLKRLGMAYKKYTKADIERKYPFRNLPQNYEGIFAPDNGVINVPLLLRTLYRLAQGYGAKLQQHTFVKQLEPYEDHWIVQTLHHGKQEQHHARKIIITSGAYVNHILRPSFDIQLKLDIWEMVASYFSVDAGPRGTVFPSMWFQFQGDNSQGQSQLFYGFPALPWGPPNIARIAVDAATHRIHDPDERHANVVSPEDITISQNFIRNHVEGVDPTVPASTLTCLQTNVFDNMFVLDYLPDKYLKGGPPKSVMVFTAGWAMKFIPLLGRALKELAIDGHSKYAVREFSIERKDSAGESMIESAGKAHRPAGASEWKAQGSIR
ncbi:hypothetical protein MW887_006874 [Aspergillus wentii]|nr:hypothetical protein MW887_006874 [Aspergillus wentii]